MTEKISLYKFKELIKGKKVKYFFRGNNGQVKEFETDRFYCNSYKGVLSMPKFCLSSNSQFFKLDDKNFKAVTEFGETGFIIQDGKN